MSSELAIAVAALVFSLISFALSFWQSLATFRAQIRPVVVVEYDTGKGWVLRNIGNGPALNILVAHTRSTENGVIPCEFRHYQFRSSFDSRGLRRPRLNQSLLSTRTSAGMPTRRFSRIELPGCRTAESCRNGRTQKSASTGSRRVTTTCSTAREEAFFNRVRSALCG
jgi:hypothetical protein